MKGGELGGRDGGLWAGRDDAADGNQPPFSVQLVLWDQSLLGGLSAAFGVMVRTQKSGLVFAGREVRFGQDRRE